MSPTLNPSRFASEDFDTLAQLRSGAETDPKDRARWLVYADALDDANRAGEADRARHEAARRELLDHLEQNPWDLEARGKYAEHAHAAGHPALALEQQKIVDALSPHGTGVWLADSDAGDTNYAFGGIPRLHFSESGAEDAINAANDPWVWEDYTPEERPNFYHNHYSPEEARQYADVRNFIEDRLLPIGEHHHESIPQSS